MAFKKKTAAPKRRRTAAKKPAAAAPARRRRAAAPVARKAPSSRRKAPSAGKADLKSILMSAGLGVAGAIATSLVVGMLSKKTDATGKVSGMLDPKLVPFAPVAVGLGLMLSPMAKGNKMIREAAFGALIAGGVALARSNAPPNFRDKLAGDDDLMGLDEPQLITPELEAAAMLGLDVGSQSYDLGDDDLMGIEQNLGDDDLMGVEQSLGDDDDGMGTEYNEMAGWKTPADTI